MGGCADTPMSLIEPESEQHGRKSQLILRFRAGRVFAGHVRNGLEMFGDTADTKT